MTGVQTCAFPISAAGGRSFNLSTAPAAGGGPLRLCRSDRHDRGSVPLLRPPSGRGQRELIETKTGAFTLIDESYNANPTSIRAALEQLAVTEIAPYGRRIVILGDMLELGPDAIMLHADLAQDLIAGKVDQLFTAGSLMSHLFYAAPESMRAAHRRTAQELEEAVLSAIKPGDIVMIKGSNGSRMSRIVSAVKS